MDMVILRIHLNMISSNYNSSIGIHYQFTYFVFKKLLDHFNVYYSNIRIFQSFYFSNLYFSLYVAKFS